MKGGVLLTSLKTTFDYQNFLRLLGRVFFGRCDGREITCEGWETYFSLPRVNLHLICAVCGTWWLYASSYLLIDISLIMNLMKFFNPRKIDHRKIALSRLREINSLNYLDIKTLILTLKGGEKLILRTLIEVIFLDNFLYR